jgi:orotate phosphoribosyltransferase
MSASPELSSQIAASLLEIGAVTLRPSDPFTLTSGLKSPIYCDNRLTISYPEIREQIAEGFASIIRERYPDTEVIAGVATGGIPHAAYVSQKLNLPMIYVRDKAKGHGKENVIEGVLNPGTKVVLIEDLFSTGGSSIKAALAVRTAGSKVSSVIAIFTYQLQQTAEALAADHIPWETLTNYTALIEVAEERGIIKPEEVAILHSWRQNPAAFGKIKG